MTAPSVAIAGLGHMGDRWIDVASTGAYRLVSLFDKATRPFALERRSELRGRLVVDEAALWASRPDILVIATTAPGHAPLLLRGLEQGVRRFVLEKPLATSCDEAARMAEAAHRAGARIIVNHGRDYSPNYARLRVVADRFGLGPLRAICVTMGAAGTGCVGIHFLHLFNRLFSADPQTVVALGTTPRGPNPRGEQFDDPGCAALIIYPGERRAHLDVGDDTGINPRTEIIFERGRVLIESEVEPWAVQHRTVDSLKEPLTRYGAAMKTTEFPEFAAFGIIDMAAAALADAAADTPPIADIQSAYRTMQLFAAVRWSMRSGNPVGFPLPVEAHAAAYTIP